MNSRVYIRVDGGYEIGLGHLVRCTALAQILMDEFDITFVCNKIPERIKTELAENNFQLLIIKNEESFKKILKPNDVVALDGYNFDTEYQKQIKAKGTKLVCIDNPRDIDSYADLLINTSPGAKQSDYKAQHYTKFALGIEYALLRPVFLQQTNKKHVIKKMETVLICFGGSDNKNLTEITLKIVLGYKKFRKIILITGSEYIYFDSLKPLINDDKRIEYYHAIDANRMFSLMIDADLAIVPASTILLELFAVGVPTITGYYIENQKEGSYELSRAGLAINCGNMLLNYNENLCAILDNISIEEGSQMVQKQKAINWIGKESYLKIFQEI